jgi:hypothetical protein
MFYAVSGHRFGQAITVQTLGEARALFALSALGFIALALEIAVDLACGHVFFVLMLA